MRLSCSVLMWLVFVSAKGLDLHAATWVEVLLMASILILMPLAGSLCGATSPNYSRIIEEFLIGLLMVLALLLPIPSLLATTITGLWLAHRLKKAWLAVQGWLVSPTVDSAVLCRLAAAVFPSIGAAWLLAYRLNWMPFGFDALIVLLTAAHFHHAGFTLPLMAGLCGKALPGRLSRLSCLLILAGVPLVAVGITCTHFKVLAWVEPISVAVLVSGALGVATLQMRMAFLPTQTAITGSLFFVSGLSLFTAMALALSFGLRWLFPQWALSMPAMWAIHGTLNTFGFGLFGIIAWRAWENRRILGTA